MGRNKKYVIGQVWVSKIGKKRLITNIFHKKVDGQFVEFVELVDPNKRTEEITFSSFCTWKCRYKAELQEKVKTTDFFLDFLD